MPLTHRLAGVAAMALLAACGGQEQADTKAAPTQEV